MGNCGVWHLVRALGTCCVLVLPLASVRADEPADAEKDNGPHVVELEWRSEKGQSYATHTSKLAEEAPEGVPCPGSPERTRFAQIPLREDQVLLVAVEIEGGKGRVWVDTGFDGRLEDDAPLPFDQGRSRRRTTTTTLSVPGAEGEESLSIPLELRQDAADVQKRIRYRLRIHRTGTCVLERRARDVLLHDLNGDLDFGDREDAAFLDTDGDGRILQRRGGREHIRFGETFAVRDRGYVATLDGAAGERITFQPTAETPPSRSAPWTARSIPPAGVMSRVNEDRLPELIGQFERIRVMMEKFGGFAGPRTPFLEMIGAVGSKKAFTFLYRVYKTEESVELKAAAVEAMGNAAYIEHASKVKKIARAAKQSAIRIAAIEALHKMDAPDRYKTYAGLLRKARDDAVFEKAVKYLAFTRRPEARKTLTDLLRRGAGKDRARFVYEAATRYEDAPPTPALIEAAAKAKDPVLRALALKDACTVSPVLAYRLALRCAATAKKEPAVVPVLVDILGSWGGAEAVALVLPLAAAASPPDLLRLAQLLALERDDAAIAQIVEALGSKAPETRAVAAEALAKLPGAGIDKALTARAKRERNEVVILALLDALRARRVASSVEPVIDAANRCPANDAVQIAALRTLGAIGFDDPAAERHLAERATSKSWSQRVSALQAAAESEDPAAIPVLVKGLADAVARVRVAAAKGLGQIRVRGAIPPLIARLESEEDGRVRDALAASLFRITGQSLYDVAERWRTWWNEKGETFVVPEAVPVAPKGTRGHTVARFYGVPVRSDRIVFVIDMSGSMDSGTVFGDAGEAAPSDFDRAVEETLKVVSKLKDSARVDVILFQSHVVRWRGKLVELTKARRKALKRFLESKHPDGGTNLYAALEAALKTKGVEAVYFLSDGYPGEGKFIETDDIVREAKALLERSPVEIHGVALGYRSDLLQQLAQVSGGTYVTK